MMFRMIGGAVVYGFALYGAARFIDRPKVEVLIKAGTSKQKGTKLGEAPADETSRPGNAEMASRAGEAAEAVRGRAAG